MIPEYLLEDIHRVMASLKRLNKMSVLDAFLASFDATTPDIIIKALLNSTESYKDRLFLRDSLESMAIYKNINLNE